MLISIYDAVDARVRYDLFTNVLGYFNRRDNYFVDIPELQAKSKKILTKIIVLYSKDNKIVDEVQANQRLTYLDVGLTPL